MTEILAPAGNLACARAAIANGANAVYLGLSSFSARQSADNFDLSELSCVIKEAHLLGVKVYVAMNTLIKDSETEAFFQSLLQVWALGADAIIMQDLLLGKALHTRYPQIILHASTQAGICNVEGAKFAKECGFSRVILARETPLAEIERIAQMIETETFVQGALCTAYSGQCYFSSFAGGNSGNRGRCKQPCRKRYAYDRNGKTHLSYALSLSDLCVGEDIQRLVSAGVTSFKIEGRMRRAEYVAAATKYYRILLDGAQGKDGALSDLKRSYNRGNYTKGLAFGQDKRLLSTAVQGHIGEKVGVVKVQNGQYLVESKFQAQTGDAFKILRDGAELGGAVYQKTLGKCFVIASKIRLKNGDGVFITTDTAVNERVLSARKSGKLTISLVFAAGQKAVAQCGNITVFSDEELQCATSRPLTADEIRTCFLKTDGLPVEIEFEDIHVEGEIFIPKSSLNAFRRKFYEEIITQIQTQGNHSYTYQPIAVDKPKGANEKTAVIVTKSCKIGADVLIYKPDDLRADTPQELINENAEKYLYFPAFATSQDVERIEKTLIQGRFDGVYAETYAGLQFAKEKGVKAFAGTGLNLTNAISLQTLLNDYSVCYYAVSKELNAQESANLIGENAFVFSFGDIKLMDLCYCPFGKSCSACDKRQAYTLTDENGRAFPVRRTISANGDCRFEVYNCASLISKGIYGAGKLLDFSVTKEPEQAYLAKDSEEAQKHVYENYTSGHFKRGVE